MRKLMYFTMGFAAVCGLCAYLLPDGLRMPLIFVAAAMMLLFAAGGSRFPVLRKCAMVFLGCMLGVAWYDLYDAHYLAVPASMDGQIATVTIRTVDYGFETDYGVAVDGTISIDEKTYQIRAYLDETDVLEPGYVITGPFRFRLTTPDGTDASRYHQGEGIFLLAYQQDEIAVSKAPEENWQDSVARFRRTIKDILHRCFPADAVPFARALLLGDTTEIDYETDSDFKISGIRHVVAVSGLHVSILFALLSAAALRKKYLMALLGFPTLFFFAALAGFTPSVTRACLMSALMLLALLLNREYDGATALSFAALVMLAVNPLVITSVSFQLSAASVAGIYSVRPGIQGWMLSLPANPAGKGLWHTLIHWFTTSMSITLSAMVFTTPLCAYYFGTVSLIGAVTNLLALWIISFIFYGILAVCAVYFLWNMGGVLIGKLVFWPIRYVLFIAGRMADVPLAAVYTESVYITAWLVFVYLLLAVFLLSKNRKPVIFSCCAALGLCLALLASWLEPMKDDVRLTVLDVGQGQCLLLQSEGKNFLIDCGGDSDAAAADTAAEALLSQGITELDGMILTHLDRDHAGAVQNLLTRIDAALLILPPERTDIASSTAGEVVYAEDDLTLTFGNTVVSIYAPTYPGTSNEKSLCVLFDTEKCDILITGDRSGFGERMLLHYAEIPDVDILIAGHHGSKYSTCEELLQASAPETVCISAGEDNYFGHPASELLQRLAQFGCTVYRTDKHGTITIRR